MRGKRRLLKLRKLLQLLSVVCALLMLTMTNQVLAEGLSDDNSLTSLGIQTDGVTVSPEFSFDIWNYDVTVPAGTTELSLSPELSNPTATINSVSGTTLNEDGSGRVVITVTAEDGSVIEYVLNVTAAQMPVDPAEAVAENEAALQEAVPAPETQRPRPLEAGKRRRFPVRPSLEGRKDADADAEIKADDETAAFSAMPQADMQMVQRDGGFSAALDLESRLD